MSKITLGSGQQGNCVQRNVHFVFILQHETLKKCVKLYTGRRRFYDKMEIMLGFRINPWIGWCWCFLAPMFCSVSFWYLINILNRWIKMQKNAWRCPSVSCWLNWWLDWGLKLPYLYFQALTYLKALSRNELNEKTCLFLINTLNDYALILICSSSSSLTWQHISHWLTVSTFIPRGAKLLVGCWRHRHWPAFRLWWFTNSSSPQEQSERYMIR